MSLQFRDRLLTEDNPNFDNEIKIYIKENYQYKKEIYHYLFN